MSKKCSLRVMGDKGPLYGTAAQLAYISKKGGWDEYHKELIAEITEEVYYKIMDKQNKPNLKIIK